jgi:hypothetical protein
MLHLGQSTNYTGAQCAMNKHESIDRFGKTSRFASLMVLSLLGVIYTTLILGLITLAFIRFMLKSLWFRRQRTRESVYRKTTVIEGDYQLLDVTDKRRSGHVNL